MRIHLHLPRLGSCLFWPIAKSGLSPVFASGLGHRMKRRTLRLASAAFGPIAKSEYRGRLRLGNGLKVGKGRLSGRSSKLVAGPGFGGFFPDH